eukprot:jgi/Bigna1/136587/aug1.34_g11295
MSEHLFQGERDDDVKHDESQVVDEPESSFLHINDTSNDVGIAHLFSADVLNFNRNVSGVEEPYSGEDTSMLESLLQGEQGGDMKCETNLMSEDDNESISKYLFI